MPPETDAKHDEESEARSDPNPHVLMLFSLGFMESRVYKVARALLEAPARVTLLCWDRDGKLPASENVEGIEVERIRIAAGTNVGPGLRQKLKFLSFYREVLRRIRTLRFDVIHCVNLDALLIGSLIARIRRVRLVYDAHEPNYYAYWKSKHSLFRGLLRALERRLSRRADLVVVTSAYQKRKYESFGARNVLLLPNYAERRLVRRRPARADTAAFRFGRIGSIYEDTGVLEIVEAFARVRARHPRATLKLAGRLHGAYAERVREAVARVEGVELRGEYAYEELGSLYQDVDVSILPYRITPWFENISPVKFFESMSFGVPVVATDIGGIGEILRRERMGIMLETGSVDELARTMLDLVEDPGRLGPLAERAHAAMMSTYNWESAIGGLFEVHPAADVARR